MGLNWLISLNELRINGILADEMGLGKTIQVIAFLAYLSEARGVKGPHLIVCPNSVLMNWQKEFRKWLPSLRVVKLLPRKELRFDTFREVIKPRKFDVVLTTYEGINICRRELKRIKWRYVIVDEAHRLKNEESLLAKNLREFSTEQKILMTGTPLQNNLRELWALLNFILPELFDDPELFELSKQVDKSGTITPEQQEIRHVELIQAMHRILRPFILKRSKDTVDLKLPPKSEVHLYVGLTSFQVNLYKSILAKKPFTTDAPAIRNILMQLRKCCNHPFLFQGIHPEDADLESLVNSSGKMLLLDKLLTRLRSQKRQVLIFSQFTSMLTILEDYLCKKNYPYCRIDGETWIEERERQIEEFTHDESEKFVFLLSTRAGGLGINLVSADTVVIFDSDFNPQVDLQAMDRAHRIGQKNEVRVYRFISESTIEEKIVERQKIKMKWDNLVILKGKTATKQIMGKRELAELVNFGANTIFRVSGGTFKDEDIDQILEQGEKRTAMLSQKIEDNFKAKEPLLDLNIESINIYQFEGDDYQSRRAADEAAIRQAVEEEVASHRFKKRTVVIPIDVEPPVVISLPDHHFYQSKPRLIELLGRGDDLSPEEEAERDRLLATGFKTWNKHDLSSLLRAVERLGPENISAISLAIGRSEEDTAEYLKVLLERIAELPDSERILRNLEKAQKQRESKAEKEALLRRKCENVPSFEELEFEEAPYNKVRSKIFSIIHDKFLLFHAYKLGLGSSRAIKLAFQENKLFRFDFYIRSARESILSKRIIALIKMVQNEEEYLTSQKYLLHKQKLEQKKRKETENRPISRPKQPKSKNSESKIVDERLELVEIEPRDLSDALPEFRMFLPRR